MLTYINKLVKKLKASEKGQGMVEYALIIAFVAAIAIVALNNGLGTTIKNAFAGASNAVSQASKLAQDYSKANAGNDGGEGTVP